MRETRLIVGQRAIGLDAFHTADLLGIVGRFNIAMHHLIEPAFRDYPVVLWPSWGGDVSDAILNGAEAVERFQRDAFMTAAESENGPQMKFSRYRFALADVETLEWASERLRRAVNVTATPEETVSHKRAESTDEKWKARLPEVLCAVRTAGKGASTKLVRNNLPSGMQETVFRRCLRELEKERKYSGFSRKRRTSR